MFHVKQRGEVMEGISRFIKPQNSKPITIQDIIDTFEELRNAGNYPCIDLELLNARRRLIRMLNMIHYMKYYYPGDELR